MTPARLILGAAVAALPFVFIAQQGISVTAEEPGGAGSMVDAGEKSSVIAQLQPQKAQPPAKAPVAAAPAKKGAEPAPPPAAAAAPAGPVRTETITYDSWTVSCRETVGANAKKVCQASMALQMVKDNKRQVLGAWVMERNPNPGGPLVMLLQTPMFQTQTTSAGVSVAKGVELKLGNGSARKLAYSACEPQRCVSSMSMDDAVVREAVAAANATITIYGKDGTALNISVPSVKGIDKAIAALK